LLLLSHCTDKNCFYSSLKIDVNKVLTQECINIIHTSQYDVSIVEFLPVSLDLIVDKSILTVMRDKPISNYSNTQVIPRQSSLCNNDF